MSNSRPTNRTEFKNYCMNRLGSPVIQINVTDDQVDARIDDALSFYSDYHFNGLEKQYYKVQATPTDILNQYFTLPANIQGVTRVFPVGTGYSTNSIFSIRYQMALNDIFDITSTELAPYFITMQYYQMVEQLLVGAQPVRFNANTNILHIDMDWDRINVGQYIIVECYMVLDPDVYTDVWNDRWLKEYATTLIKLQWGEILNKFTDQELPGGMKFNGSRILSDAQAMKEKMEQEMIDKYGGVLEWFMG